MKSVGGLVDAPKCSVLQISGFPLGLEVKMVFFPWASYGVSAYSEGSALQSQGSMSGHEKEEHT